MRLIDADKLTEVRDMIETMKGGLPMGYDGFKPEIIWADELNEKADRMAKEVRDMIVNHPEYYNDGNIEVIDFIEDKKLGFNLGNVVKYVSRAGKKGDYLTDLEKARWYLDREINNQTSLKKRYERYGFKKTLPRNPHYKSPRIVTAQLTSGEKSNFVKIERTVKHPHVDGPEKISEEKPKMKPQCGQCGYWQREGDTRYGRCEKKPNEIKFEWSTCDKGRYSTSSILSASFKLLKLKETKMVNEVRRKLIRDHNMTDIRIVADPILLSLYRVKAIKGAQCAEGLARAECMEKDVEVICEEACKLYEKNEIGCEVKKG